MESLNIQLPLEKRAFDHPPTRRTWESARRRARRGLILWIALWVAALFAVGALRESGLHTRVHPDVITMGCITLFFLSVTTVASSAGVLLCLKRIRAVLEAEQWRLIPGARRREGVKDIRGVPVQLRCEDGAVGDGWTDLLSARDPVKRRRWPEGMEQGAWFAGNRHRGVLTLPGGGDLLEVGPRSGS